MNLHPRPINFKFGDYISKGIDLVKKDMGTLILSLLATLVLSFIPFCGLMARGNFYKICYKIDTGKNVSASEIFNFDDFTPYFMAQLYLIAGFFAIFFPFLFLGIFVGDDGELSFIPRIIAIFYILGVYFLIIFFLLQAFYIPALFTFKKIKDVKTAWNISRVMTKDNLWNIILFSIVVSFLAQLGIILCAIGLLITFPFYYTATYFAYKDAMEQIEIDELQEIGTISE